MASAVKAGTKTTIFAWSWIFPRPTCKTLPRGYGNFPWEAPLGVAFRWLSPVHIVCRSVRRVFRQFGQAGGERAL